MLWLGLELQAYFVSERALCHTSRRRLPKKVVKTQHQLTIMHHPELVGANPIEFNKMKQMLEKQTFPQSHRYVLSKHYHNKHVYDTLLIKFKLTF